METVNQFLERIYVNHAKDKVFVWKSKESKLKEESKFEVWSIKTATNYLFWLEKQ